MKRQTVDPVIDEIREVRHQISARFSHDPRRMVAHYVQQQERHRERLLRDDDVQGEGTELTSETRSES